MMSNRSGIMSSVPRVAVEKSRRANWIPTGENRRSASPVRLQFRRNATQGRPERALDVDRQRAVGAQLGGARARGAGERARTLEDQRARAVQLAALAAQRAGQHVQVAEPCTRHRRPQTSPSHRPQWSAARRPC